MLPTISFPDFSHIGLWEVFLLAAIGITALFVVALVCVRPMPLIPYVSALVWTTVAIIVNPPEQLQPPVFWVLVAACLPFTFEEGNLASVIVWGLFISHLSLLAAAMPIVFKLLFVLVYPAILFVMEQGSVMVFLCWLAVAWAMLDRIHFLMHPGYWAGWFALSVFLPIAFTRESPLSWDILGTLLLASLWWLTGTANEGVEQFVIFALATSVLTGVRMLFTYVYMYPETYLFPFNLVSRWYKVPSQSWSPIGKLGENAPHALCGQCHQLTSSSTLIMGSWAPLVSLVEWHTLSPTRSSLMNISPCDLCPLIWHSAGLDAMESRQGEEEGKWKMKIWQERPISRYTFAKLYRDDEPVGLRLLIHRRKNFNDAAPSINEACTDSVSHMSLAKSWLDDCKNHHPACNGVGNAPRRPPTRLIHVEKSAEAEAAYKIKLTLTDSSDSAAPLEYLAFSHCWGGSGTLQLSQKNFEDCQSGINFSGLSKNMRDAIIVTEKLGFSYIWIDSLCIIQDSADDWKAEAARMEDVYAGATCTIASTGSASGDGGCFHMRSSIDRRSLKACRIGTSDLSGHGADDTWIYIRRDDLSDFRRGVDRAPLNTRGWVLQERLLSRRTLHFGADMIYWECCLRSASELCPMGYVYKQHPTEYYGDFLPPPIQVELDGSDLVPVTKWRRSLMILRRVPQPDLHLFDREVPSSRGVWRSNQAFMKETKRHSYQSWAQDSRTGRYRTALEQIQDGHYQSAGILSFAQSWYAIVESYTRSNLSFSTDRWMAMQGIVDEVQRATKQRYIAGMWEEYLVECLLWFVVHGLGSRLLETVAPGKSQATDNPRLVQGPPMAPTWSWVSVDGAISINQFPVNAARKVYTTRLATSYSAAVSAATPGPAGQKWNAVQGVLEIEAPLTPISRFEFHHGEWYIYVGYWARRRSARLLPDLASFVDDVNAEPSHSHSGLFCLSLLTLRRETEFPLHIKTREVQGIVVKRLQEREGLPDVYERVGFFSTSLVEGGSWHLGILRKGGVKKIHVI